jgi:hypothetical protein
MVKPVNPSNPTGGDGNEKYNPNQKRGPSDYDRTVEKLDKEKAAEKARAEVNKMAKKHEQKKMLNAHAPTPKDCKIWADYLSPLAVLVGISVV